MTRRKFLAAPLVSGLGLLASRLASFAGLAPAGFMLRVAVTTTAGAVLTGCVFLPEDETSATGQDVTIRDVLSRTGVADHFFTYRGQQISGTVATYTSEDKINMCIQKNGVDISQAVDLTPVHSGDKVSITLL